MAMALTLILLALAFTFLDQLYNTTDLAGTMADVNENLRAAVNVISRDLSTSGWQVPQAGILIPSGTGTTAIKMPGLGPSCSPTPCTFPANGGYMGIITPGPGMGPSTTSGTANLTWSVLQTTPVVESAVPTDQITMISVNPLSALTTASLTGTALTGLTVTTGAGGVATVTTPTNIVAAGASQVLPGQLIMLQTATGTCLLTVTATPTTNAGPPVSYTMTFKNGDPNDVLGLNQFLASPVTGTVVQLNAAGTPPTTSTYAYPVNMVTYYLDTSTPQQRLMRQLGTATAQPVALGINVLQFSYSLDPPATPTDPTRSPATLNTIRKVNLWVVAKADHPNRKSGRYFANSIATSVAIQNLAYSNQFP